MAAGDGIVLMPGEGKKLVLPDRGAEVTLKVMGAATGGRFALAESAPAPGASGLPFHRHRNSDEVLYVLRGSLMIRVGEATTRAPAGSVALIPRGTGHAFWNPGPEEARVLILFVPAGLERYLEETADALARHGGRPDAALLQKIRERHDTEFL